VEYIARVGVPPSVPMNPPAMKAAAIAASV